MTSSDDLTNRKGASGQVVWSLRRRFHKGDVITIGVATLGIFLIEIMGRIVVAIALHLSAEALINWRTIGSTLVWSFGLALALALIQAQANRITVYGSLSAWLLVVLIIAVITLNKHERSDLDVAKSTLVVLAALVAIVWLHVRRSSR